MCFKSLFSKYPKMKKMKLIKVWITAFLLWEIATLLYQDKELRTKMCNKESKCSDKLKLMVDKLVDLNKRIFFDIKEYNYKNNFETVKSKFLEEKDIIWKQILELKEKAMKINNETIKPTLIELENNFESLKEKLQDKWEDVSEKYDVEEKIKFIKWKIVEVKEKIKVK